MSTLLRARGGISTAAEWDGHTPHSSPRTRRYFHCSWSECLRCGLFSAHAEVFPPSRASSVTTTSLLRARGGISDREALAEYIAHSSPRTRRYFRLPLQGRRLEELFSAHAEVFPSAEALGLNMDALLRARGGISGCDVFSFLVGVSSPRTRRYFR